MRSSKRGREQLFLLRCALHHFSLRLGRVPANRRTLSRESRVAHTTTGGHWSGASPPPLSKSEEPTRRTPLNPVCAHPVIGGARAQVAQPHWPQIKPGDWCTTAPRAGGGAIRRGVVHTRMVPPPPVDVPPGRQPAKPDKPALREEDQAVAACSLVTSARGNAVASQVNARLRRTRSFRRPHDFPPRATFPRRWDTKLGWADVGAVRRSTAIDPV